MTRAAERQLDSVMNDALAVGSRRRADGLEQSDSALLQHTGANTRQHVLAVLAFQNDVVDTGAMQKLTQQQPGRTRADDHNLGAQLRSPPERLLAGRRALAKIVMA